MTIEVIIDFGQSRVKYAFRNKEGEIVTGVFENRFNPVPDRTSTGCVVTQFKADGTTVKTEIAPSREGQKNLVEQKTEYKHLDDFIFAIGSVIAEEYKTSDKFIGLHIKTLLPPNQFKSDVVYHDYKQMIEKFGTIKGRATGILGKRKVTNRELEVIVKSVMIACEGVSSLNVLGLNNYSIEDEDSLFLLDVGSSTVDWVVVDKTDGAWRVSVAGTIGKCGGTAIFSELEQQILNNYKEVREISADLLESTMSFRSEGKKNKVTDVVDLANSTLSRLITNVKTNDRGLPIVVFGGGSQLLKESKTFIQAFRNISFVEDPEVATFGNVIGPAMKIKSAQLNQ